jgi:hypothetical protein
MENRNLEEVVVADKTRPEPKALPNADLSVEIARTVAKEKGERVKVRRVYGDKYRCNWLAPDDRVTRGGTLALETFRIRDSKFLRVTKTESGLEIEDLTAVANSN